jgi:hypothetical protein
MNPGRGADLGGGNLIVISIMQDSHPFIYGQLVIFYLSDIIPSVTRRMSYPFMRQPFILDGPN